MPSRSTLFLPLIAPALSGAFFVTCAFAPSVHAQALTPATEESETVVRMPELLVTATNDPVEARLQNAEQNYPGSVETVTPEELALQDTGNIGEILVRLPGAVYVDEDGRGTKPNFSLRGLDPIRSEFVQLLLDGVPIQPSLYSEQAAYYGVPSERLAGIEVFKGGASILFGPNTVGGVVNLISRPPSSEPFAGVLDTRFDSYGDYSANLFLSGTQGNVFAGIEYLHKGGDGFRDALGYTIDDVDVKVGYHFNEDHWVQLRLQYYKEETETPGGLLPYQFNRDVTQSNKPYDEFYGERIGADIRSSHQLTDNQQVNLLFYAFQFERNWFLQNYVDNTTTDLELADNNSQYLRKFNVIGFEPNYVLDYDLGQSTGHQLTLGARVYLDKVDRRVATGNTGRARESNHVLNSQEDLTTFVLAGYVQNEFQITSRLSLVPGLRFEHIEQTLEDVFNGDPEEHEGTDIWLPGVGLKYDFTPEIIGYANVTRSFRPPSFGDAFNPTISASNADLDASKAWTYETGVRANPYPWLAGELGGYYTKFSDQVVISDGVAANYDTVTYGLEATAEIGLLGLSRGIREQAWNEEGDHEIYLLGGATLVSSTFDNGEFSGNDIPYVPNQAFTYGIRYEYRDIFQIVFQGRYVGERFTDNANTVPSNATGTIGALHNYAVYDLKARWQVKSYLALNAGITNIFDEKYGTQRRTSQQKGIFPGPTRAVYVGATLTF